MNEKREPAAVWEHTKRLLRDELSKVDFETWVEDSQGIFLDESTLVVEVCNRYGRDWLGKYVRLRAERQLRLMMGRSVEVRFVVDGEEPELTLNTDRDDQILLESRYLSIYDEIVKPERVVAFPSYYLRWIPWLGADLAWVPIGFRQAAYLHGCRHEEGDEFEASACEIARWSGMSRAKFWRRVNDPFLKWFIRKVPNETMFHWDEKEKRFQKHPNSWQIVMSIPLTPADVISLSTWMRERRDSGMAPVSILKAAIETPLDELLPWLKEVLPPEEGGKPLGVWDVVIQVFGENLDVELKPILHQLADELTNHIHGRTVLVSHYFIEKWIPLLKSGPGWLVTLLRNRCYYNQETKELRDEIWIAGGYGELASRLGYRRPKTVIEWITGNGRGSQRLKQFIQRTERVKRSDQGVALSFKMRMQEPLTPEGQKVYEEQTREKGQGANDTMKKGGQGANETMRKGGQGANATMRKGGQGANETIRKGRSGRECDSIKDSLIKELKDLKYFKDLKNTTTSMIMVNDSGEAREMVVGLSWDLSRLLKHNRIDDSVIRELTTKGVNVKLFVSWLLYGASLQGAMLNNPVAHAVSRLRKNPIKGAGEGYDDLACLPPDKLAYLVSCELNGTAKYRGNKDWNRVMERAERGRIKNLAVQLGLVLDEGDDP